jgi:hypothetical protein
MPAMNDLLTQLQDSPPQTEMDLKAMLDQTGYDLVMKEPMMDEAPEDMGPADGPAEEMGEAEAADAMDEMDDLMGAMLPPPTADGNDLSPKGRGKMRVKVAKFALADDKKKRGGTDE